MHRSKTEHSTGIKNRLTVIKPDRGAYPRQSFHRKVRLKSRGHYMIKALLHETYTKRDASGNVYHTVRVTNPRTGDSFTTWSPAISNVVSILGDIFGRPQEYYQTATCTGSTRVGSLPSNRYLDSCNESKEWRDALRGIGYKVAKK